MLTKDFAEFKQREKVLSLYSDLEKERILGYFEGRSQGFKKNQKFGRSLFSEPDFRWKIGTPSIVFLKVKGNRESARRHFEIFLEEFVRNSSEEFDVVKAMNSRKYWRTEEF